MLQTEQPPSSEEQLQNILNAAMERADLEMMQQVGEHPSSSHAVETASSLSSSAFSLPVSHTVLHQTATVSVAVKSAIVAIGLLALASAGYFLHKREKVITERSNAVVSSRTDAPSIRPESENQRAQAANTKFAARQLAAKPTKGSVLKRTSSEFLSNTALPSNSTTAALVEAEVQHSATADSLLPEIVRGIALPQNLAKALSERRFKAALVIADSLVNSAQTARNYALRGHMQLLLKNTLAAIDDYEESLAIEPDGALFMARGSLLLDNNKPQEAWKDFNTALGIKPRDSQAVFLRAASSYAMKRFEEACDDWSFAAQMGHPKADSVMSVNCIGYVPSYVRTAINEEKKKVSDIFRRMREVEKILRLEHVPTNINKIRLDSNSYSQLGAECGTASALNRKGSALVCNIHYLFRFAYEQQDGIFMVYCKNLHQSVISLAFQNSGGQKSPQQDNNPALRDDGRDYDQLIAKEVQNGGSTEKIQDLQSKKMRQMMVRNINQVQNEQSLKQAPQIRNQEALRVIDQAIRYFRDEYKVHTDSNEISSAIRSLDTDVVDSSDAVIADSTLPEEFRTSDCPKEIQRLVKKQAYQSALQKADSLLLFKQSAALFTVRGNLNKAMKHLPEAQRDYTRSLTLNESYEAYFRRGMVNFEMQQFLDAKNDFSAALRIVPTSAQAVFCRGAANYNMRLFEAACDDWSFAAQMGHPKADSTLEEKCVGYVPKYARTAMETQTERRQAIMTLVKVIQQRFVSERIPTDGNTIVLGSESYKQFTDACSLQNITDKSLPFFCDIHLLYAVVQKEGDNTLEELVKRLHIICVNISRPSSNQSKLPSAMMSKNEYDEAIRWSVLNTPIEQTQQDIDRRLSQHSITESPQLVMPSQSTPSPWLQGFRTIQEIKKYLSHKFSETAKE